MALDQQATRQPHNFLRDRYNCDASEILQFFALRGFTLREASERLGMKYSTIKTQAWELGIVFSNGKDAIDRHHRVTYQGTEYSIRELAELMGMSRRTLSDRLRYGWPLDKAISEPVRQGNWQHREGRDREPQADDVETLWLRKAWKL